MLAMVNTTANPLVIAQVIRDGGGTAPVELTVAAKLRDRGHDVRLYGPPEVREHADTAGFELETLDWPADAEGDMIPRMIGASAAWARTLAPHFRAGADLVIADCVAFGAPMAARLAGVPCAAVMPTVYVGDQARGSKERWARATAGLNRARTALGLPAVASVTEQLLDADRLLVLTSRAFELPEVRPPAHVRYVGPQLPAAHAETPYRPPAGDGPLVLVSLSTTDQGQLELLERLLAAVAGLPVRALVTLGPAVDADRLRPPANATLARYVPHDLVLPHAGLVVTHAGHGTVLAAVRAGVPLVCVPMGRDQPAVAERVTRHGLGVALDQGSDVGRLRAAIRGVLADPAYREAVRRMAATVEDRVVDEVEVIAATHDRRLPSAPC